MNSQQVKEYRFNVDNIPLQHAAVCSTSR